eukprot:363537-Chlamydomonas_euryale.AAC.3
MAACTWSQGKPCFGSTVAQKRWLESSGSETVAQKQWLTNSFSSTVSKPSMNAPPPTGQPDSPRPEPRSLPLNSKATTAFPTCRSTA